MEMSLSEFVKTMPKIEDNLTNLVSFYKNLDFSLSKLEKKLKEKSRDEKDMTLFHVYGKYFIGLDEEYKRLRKMGKFESFKVNSDYLDFLKRVYSVQGQILEVFGETDETEQKYSFYWWSNVNYTKSATIADYQKDYLHSAKQFSNIAENWLLMFESTSDSRYLSNAKRSFLKVMEESEKLNNKSVHRDVHRILTSSKDLEILLLLEGSISYN